MSWNIIFTDMGFFTMRLYHSYIHYINHKQNYMKTLLQGRIQGGAQGARAPPLNFHSGNFPTNNFIYN